MTNDGGIKEMKIYGIQRDKNNHLVVTCDGFLLSKELKKIKKTLIDIGYGDYSKLPLRKPLKLVLYEKENDK